MVQSTIDATVINEILAVLEQEEKDEKAKEKK